MAIINIKQRNGEIFITECFFLYLVLINTVVYLERCLQSVDLFYISSAVNAGFSAFIRQPEERVLPCRRVMENQLGLFCKYSFMPISWKMISEQLRGLIVSAFLFASVRPNSAPAWIGGVVLADFSNTRAWPKAFSWGVVMGHWQPRGNCEQNVPKNGGFLQQCPGKLQGRSTACSYPGGRGNPSQLQSYSPYSNTRTQGFAHPHMENLNVFNFTDCVLNLIRFYSWN